MVFGSVNLGNIMVSHLDAPYIFNSHVSGRNLRKSSNFLGTWPYKYPLEGLKTQVIAW